MELLYCLYINYSFFTFEHWPSYQIFFGHWDLIPPFWKHIKQSSLWHVSFGNWLDWTRFIWELIPPLSITLVRVPAGLRLFFKFFLTNSARSPLGVAGTVRVLVAPLVLNHVSLESPPVRLICSLLSSLFLYILWCPSRWLERSALHFLITLFKITLLKGRRWPLLLKLLLITIW